MPLDGTEVSPDALVLIDARGYLERGWCRDMQGMNADGQPVQARSSTAVRWCLIGALVRAMSDDSLPAAMHRIAQFVPGGFQGIAAFNNSQDSVDPVLAVMDLAIADALDAR